MSTMPVGPSAPARIAERLGALLARKVSAAEVQQFGTFATQLLARAQGYLTTLADEEIAQLVLSAFRFFQAPGPLPRVRVFTPTYVDEGWDAPWTVIETCLGDRPFIVDTIHEELRAQNLDVRMLLHPIFAVTRDAAGGAERTDLPTHGAVRESFLHVAVGRVADTERLRALEQAIRDRVHDLLLVTEDFGSELARAQAMATEFEQLGRTREPKLAAEATAIGDFLRWLVDGGFVFLGYREYAFAGDDGARTVALRNGTGLGLLRREEQSRFRTPQPVQSLPRVARRRILGGRLLTIGKTRALAPVHRRVAMDDLGFAALDAAGRIVGERRFVGLFTSKAYAEEAAEIPLLRRMLRQILAAEGVISGSHDWRELVGAFNGLPKSTLFTSTPEEVRADIQTILAAERSNDVVVSIREVAEGDRLSVLVVMPRSRISGEARGRVAALVQQRLGVELIDDHLHVGDDDPSSHARLHLAFTRGEAPLDGAALDELAAAIDAVLERWTVRLREALVARHGADVGERLAARFSEAFPSDYVAATPIERAVDDVRCAEAALASGTPQLVLDPVPVDGATTLRVYLAGEALVLTDVLPFLDAAGIRTLVEDRVRLDPPGGTPVFLHRFLVQDTEGHPLDVAASGDRLIDLLLAVRGGRTSSDVLSRLVVAGGLDWRAVACLRAYAAYAVQAGLGARREVWGALAENPEPARRLFAVFAARFGTSAGEGEAAERFVASLDDVQVLREDLCLRGLLALVQATVRTTFFSRDAASDRLVLKLRCADVPFLAEPRPHFETHVSSPRVEGLHLRAGLVARGGLRLSDRPDDFRTEVFGLMRTQTMKNAIIVPSGAKGAFVPQRDAPSLVAYRDFVEGLLEITDDVVDGAVVHPPGLRIHDGDDPYLVVAADKGTATYSDEANALALARGFWLGDAFASGGSHGYDHKAIGITARGAWESVRTHFRERDVDADHAAIRVAGIGDMSGDVFGNGLLRSPHVALVAAFDYRDVFLDPDPDPAASFAERRRLYESGGAWSSYDPTVRSRGAMVVARSAKRTALTAEVRRLLGVTDEVLSGEALVRAVLTLDVDLLWNGGVGTYVRAPDETDAAVGDPANDAVRVEATALRARVVAEGGNLGVTQRGRVAYALAGGGINMDAVDNSAGVDLSDHEVNLKICLAPLVAAGALTTDARNALLADVQDEVAAHVLAHNASQSRLLTVDRRRSQTRLDDFRQQMADLERALAVPRDRLGLPDWESLHARQVAHPGLTRPELAVLVAWTKIELASQLRPTALVDDRALEPFLLGYFPTRFRAEHPDAIHDHRLRRELVVVELVNALVDGCGATFAHRLARETGRTIPDVCRAWVIAWALLDGTRLVQATRLPAVADEVAAALALEELARRVTLWVLEVAPPSGSAADVVDDLVAMADTVRPRLAGWFGAAEAEALGRRRASLEMAGMAPAAAADFALVEWLPSGLDVALAARRDGHDLDVLGRRHYALGGAVDFAWIDGEIAAHGPDDAWTRRALDGIGDDLRRARLRLARLEDGPALRERLDVVRRLVDEAKLGGRASLSTLTVLAREIRRTAEVLE